MHVRKTAAGLEILAPAKLNLFFEVLSKRDDGYHEVETLMCPIDLYDSLFFYDGSDDRVRLRCRRATTTAGPDDDGMSTVPDGPENLVVRAVELVRRKTGLRRGAHLLLVKRIPAAAGLGGGSSDAAAALVAANEFWRLGAPRDELARWAAELGSDVPCFLADGPAVCRGRGERIEPVRAFGPMHFVVARPPEGLATAAVYGACRPAQRPRAPGPLLEALNSGDFSHAGRRLFNRLLQPAESLSPWVARLRRELAALDCLGYGMSGSGTACFGICRHARHARRSAGRLRAKGFGIVFTARNCR